MMPVPAHVWGTQRHDHDVAGPPAYLLMAPRTDVLLARIERLDAPHLGLRTGQRILDERHRP